MEQELNYSCRTPGKFKLSFVLSVKLWQRGKSFVSSLLMMRNAMSWRLPSRMKDFHGRTVVSMWTHSKVNGNHKSPYITDPTIHRKRGRLYHCVNCQDQESRIPHERSTNKCHAHSMQEETDDMQQSSLPRANSPKHVGGSDGSGVGP